MAAVEAKRMQNSFYIWLKTVVFNEEPNIAVDVFEAFSAYECNTVNDFHSLRLEVEDYEEMGIPYIHAIRVYAAVIDCYPAPSRSITSTLCPCFYGESENYSSYQSIET